MGLLSISGRKQEVTTQHNQPSLRETQSTSDSEVKETTYSLYKQILSSTGYPFYCIKAICDGKNVNGLGDYTLELLARGVKRWFEITNEVTIVTIPPPINRYSLSGKRIENGQKNCRI